MKSDVKTIVSKSGRVTYKINMDERTVIAKITCEKTDPQMVFDCKVARYIDGNGVGPLEISEYYENKYDISRVYVGKAKCHPDDTFDEEFGKKLALLRAKNKYLKAMYYRLDDMRRWISKLNNTITDMTQEHYRRWIDNGCEIYEIEKQTGLYEERA